jgi:hypothetical protein
LDPFSKALIPGNDDGFKGRKVLASLSIPSPKSPKLNPFSKPSPVHNPFMSIAQSKDDLWNTVSRSHSDAEKPIAENSGICAESAAAPDAKTTASSSGTSTGGKDLAEACAMEESRVYGKVYSMAACTVTNGEEDEECLYQVRAKLFKLRTRKKVEVEDAAHPKTDSGKGVKPESLVEGAADWLEVGVGPVKLLKGSNEIQRLVMRRESKIGGAGNLVFSLLQLE